MNPERFLYLTAFEKLAETRDKKLALSFLNEWSSSSNGEKTLSAAAIEYLNQFVLPNINGRDTSSKQIPRWVDEFLFHPPEQPKDIPSFMKLLESNYVELLSDRSRGGYEEVDVKNVNWSELIPRAKEENKAVYFCPLPIDGDERNPKSNSRRLDKNVKRFPSVFVDFDGGEAKKGEHLLLLELYPKPTMVVETKNGFHVYYVLEDPMTEAEWRSTQQTFIKTFGSDQVIKNPSRLLRLPFTWHCKTDDKFLVRMHSFDWKRYKKQEIFQAFHVKMEEPRQTTRKFQLSGEAPRDLRLPSLNTLGQGDRHPSLLQEAGRAYTKLDKLQAQNARDMLLFWYERACKPLKPHYKKELNDLCDWIETHEWGEVVSQHV